MSEAIKGSRSMMDFINDEIEREETLEDKPITLEEWVTIRRNGNPSEIAEAVERMEAAGGYEALQ